MTGIAVLFASAPAAGTVFVGFDQLLQRRPPDMAAPAGGALATAEQALQSFFASSATRLFQVPLDPRLQQLINSWYEQKEDQPSVHALTTYICEQCDARSQPRQPELILSPLLVNDMMVRTFAEAVKSRPLLRVRSRQLCEQLAGQASLTGCRMQQVQCPTHRSIRLNGAGLPILTRWMLYFRTCMDNVGEAYGAMEATFRSLAVKQFGPDRHWLSHWTAGTTSSFLSLKVADPRATMIVDSEDAYLPMVRRVALAREPIVLPLRDDYQDEALVEHVHRVFQLLDQADKQPSQPQVRRDNISASLTDAARLETQEPRSAAAGRPCYLLLTSVTRLGSYRRLHHEQLLRLRALAASFDLDLHIWVDASQDTRTIEGADIVWYSKRFGGSGRGVVLINQAKYAEDSALVAPLKTLSGVDLHLIADVICQLYRAVADNTCSLLLVEYLDWLRTQQGQDLADQNIAAQLSGAYAKFRDLQLDRYFTLDPAWPQPLAPTSFFRDRLFADPTARLQ